MIFKPLRIIIIIRKILRFEAVRASGAHMHARQLQSCPALWDPVACSPPGSSVPGVLQARVLEWAAMPSRGSSRPRGQTRVSRIGRRCFTMEPPGKPKASTHNTCYNFFLGLNLYCVQTLWLTGLLKSELETGFSLESKSLFKKSPINDNIPQLTFTEENIALNIFYICLKETGMLLFSYTAN